MSYFNIDKYFDFQSEKLFINSSKTRFFKLRVNTITPEAQITFYLCAQDYQIEVKFGKKTWLEIVGQARRISTALRSNKEEKIFENNEIKVFTEKMHGSIAVCFVQNNNRINMMIKTYSNLLTKTQDIKKAYKTLLIKIKNSAAYLRNFLHDIIRLGQQNHSEMTDDFRNKVLECSQHLKNLEEIFVEM